MQSYMRKCCASLCADIDLRACALRQFEMARDEIGVEMRFKNVADFQAMLVRGLQIDFHVALRVHNSRFAFRAQHVRSMRQASQIKLLKIHLELSLLAIAL